MSHYDLYVARESTKQHDNRKRRWSEGQYRLHWATVRRQTPRGRQQRRLLSRIQHWLGALQSWLKQLVAPIPDPDTTHANADTAAARPSILKQREA